MECGKGKWQTTHRLSLSDSPDSPSRQRGIRQLPGYSPFGPLTGHGVTDSQGHILHCFSTCKLKASYTGVSLKTQVDTKLPTWLGPHWTAATLITIEPIHLDVDLSCLFIFIPTAWRLSLKMDISVASNIKNVLLGTWIIGSKSSLWPRVLESSIGGALRAREGSSSLDQFKGNPSCSYRPINGYGCQVDPAQPICIYAILGASIHLKQTRRERITSHPRDTVQRTAEYRITTPMTLLTFLQ